MKKNRLFNVLLVATLFFMALLTIQGSLETVKVVMAASQSDNPVRWSDATKCILSEGDRFSIRSVYLEDVGISLPRTDSGFTGYDGGLIYLLSNYRICQGIEE
jgi:hypothetical protein